MRPAAIRRFERLYLAAFALNLLGWLLAWPGMRAVLAANPATAGAAWVLPLGLAFSMLVTLGLWYAVARGGSNVARWAVVALAVLAVGRVLVNVPAVAAGYVSVLEGAVGAAAAGLQAWAAATLFTRDARGWFGEEAS